MPKHWLYNSVIRVGHSNYSVWPGLLVTSLRWPSAAWNIMACVCDSYAALIAQNQAHASTPGKAA